LVISLPSVAPINRSCVRDPCSSKKRAGRAALQHRLDGSGQARKKIETSDAAHGTMMPEGNDSRRCPFPDEWMDLAALPRCAMSRFARMMHSIRIQQE
jgi:hypothetical protein